MFFFESPPVVVCLTQMHERKDENATPVTFQYIPVSYGSCQTVSHPRFTLKKPPGFRFDGLDRIYLSPKLSLLVSKSFFPTNQLNESMIRVFMTGRRKRRKPSESSKKKIFSTGGFDVFDSDTPGCFRIPCTFLWYATQARI